MPRPRMTHELKIWPEYFEQVRNGRMKFQLRRNDRDFKVGDELLLKEWDPEHAKLLNNDTLRYTGREILVRVDYILTAENARAFPKGHWGAYPLAADYVIMSVSLVT